jgi:hypothetical protein
MNDAELEQLMAEARRQRLEIIGKLDAMIEMAIGLRKNSNQFTMQTALAGQKDDLRRRTAQLADLLGARPVVADAITAVSESGEAVNLEIIEAFRTFGVDPIKAGMYVVTIQPMTGEPGEPEQAHSTRGWRPRPDAADQP